MGLIGHDEAGRLHELSTFRILDTPAEVQFDEIALLAAQITESPIALISFLDGHRQWFKAKIGIDLLSVPQSISFCSQAMQRNELMEVVDLTMDLRFQKNPIVVNDPKIRFYAGVPIVTAYEYAVGSICVLDTVPKKLTMGQKNALRTLQRQVVRELEARRRMDTMTTKGILDFITRETIRN